MPVYKDSERNTWYVKGRYKDWKGEDRWCTRRGFKTKREAQKWETDFKAKSHNDLSMTMDDFSALYLEEMEPRLKQSSLIAKKSILTKWILPYFGRRRVNEITGAEIIRWQNMLLSHCDERTGRPFSKNYLRNLNAQLAVLFRYAAKYYGLHDNPMDRIMGIGSSREGKCDFWTLEEFSAFSDACMEEPMAYYCFQMLYWTGIREGELLALTAEDFDFENGTVSVSKTYHCFRGKDVVTPPKTKRSVRVVGLTERLSCEMQEYLRLCYDRRAGDRMFPVQPYFLQSRIKKYAAEAGVKTIRMFNWNILLIIPFLVIVVGAVTKKPPVPTMLAASLVAILIGCFYQGFSIQDGVLSAYSGFKMDMVSGLDVALADPMVTKLLVRGGITSMASIVIIIFCGYAYTSILSGVGFVDTAMKPFTSRIRGRGPLMAAAFCTSFILLALSGITYVSAICLPDMYKRSFLEHGMPARVLSRTIEDGSTIMAPLIPWGTSGILYASTLGVEVWGSGGYGIYCFTCWFTPIIAILLAVTGIGIYKMNDAEIKAALEQYDAEQEELKHSA